MATPHKTHWVKTSAYGDYRDELQNHKDRSNLEQRNLIKRAKRLGMKHAGSKTISQLRSFVKR